MGVELVVQLDLPPACRGGSYPRGKHRVSLGLHLGPSGALHPQSTLLWLESPRACVAQAGESLLQADMTRGRNYLSFWLGFGSAQLEED